MEEIMTRDEILEGYPKLENVDELFDSDILVLPADKRGEGSFVNQIDQYEIKDNFSDVKVKFYCRSEPDYYCLKMNQAPVAIDIQGAYVLLNSVAITAFLRYLYKYYKNNPIKIEFMIKLGENTYVKIGHKNTVSNLQERLENLENLVKENLPK